MNNELAPPTGKARLMPPTVLPDLSAIVVAFDSGAQLRRCLDSIRREVTAEDITSEIVVIDNASNDETTAALAGQLDLRIFRNSHNAGFGAAVNQGFRNSRGRLVLLLNPDAELEAGSLAPLLETLNSEPETDLAAPALILPDGSRQKSPRRFYKLATILARRTPFGRTRAGRNAAPSMNATSCTSRTSTCAAVLMPRAGVSAFNPSPRCATSSAPAAAARFLGTHCCGDTSLRPCCTHWHGALPGGEAGGGGAQPTGCWDGEYEPQFSAARPC